MLQPAGFFFMYPTYHKVECPACRFPFEKSGLPKNLLSPRLPIRRTL